MRELDWICSCGRALVAPVRALIEKICKAFKFLVPIGVSVSGCTSDRSGDTAPVEQATVPAPAPAPDKRSDTGPRPLGRFNITFYYVVGEDEITAKPAVAAKAANENADHAAIAPPDDVTLFAGGSCDPIARVSRAFAQQLRIQGTGKLRDGRVLNVWGHCSCEFSPCFKVTGLQWGTAGTGRPLQPFRTVAVDPKLIKLGSLLYVPLLEGRTMPGRAPWGGFVHDGCVVADDTGGGIKDRQLDLFVGRRGWFLGMSGSGGSHSWARHVPVFDGSKICQRKGRVITRRAGSS